MIGSQVSTRTCQRAQFWIGMGLFGGLTVSQLSPCCATIQERPVRCIAYRQNVYSNSSPTSPAIKPPWAARAMGIYAATMNAKRFPGQRTDGTLPDLAGIRPSRHWSNDGSRAPEFWFPKITLPYGIRFSLNSQRAPHGVG
ncbi:hypothetical protein F5884DRAFT_167597 [Xylogone sp. PMI_703]|nr:hypothetical protein F5884DRAFT_167597 [Xylogone sp. PMI_703]